MIPDNPDQDNFIMLMTRKSDDYVQGDACDILQWTLVNLKNERTQRTNLQWW